MNDDRVLFGHLRAMLQTENGRQRFCSAVLNGGATSLADPDALRIAVRRVMPYRDYLATDYWADRSRRAKEAAGHRCQLCNELGDLDTHHRTYERRGNEDDADLTVLCIPCHKKFHKPAPNQSGEPTAVMPEDLRWVGLTEQEQVAELNRLIAEKRQQQGITPPPEPQRIPIPPALRTLKRSGTS